MIINLSEFGPDQKDKDLALGLIADVLIRLEGIEGIESSPFLRSLDNPNIEAILFEGWVVGVVQSSAFNRGVLIASENDAARIINFAKQISKEILALYNVGQSFIANVKAGGSPNTYYNHYMNYITQLSHAGVQYNPIEVQNSITAHELMRDSINKLGPDRQLSAYIFDAIRQEYFERAARDASHSRGRVEQQHSSSSSSRSGGGGDRGKRSRRF